MKKVTTATVRKDLIDRGIKIPTSTGINISGTINGRATKYRAYNLNNNEFFNTSICYRNQQHTVSSIYLEFN